MSQIEEKGSILWVMFKLKWVRFFESYSKRVQPFELHQKKNTHTILWVKLKKKVQFFESCSNKSEFDSLSHTPKRRRFYSFSHVKKKQFFELNSKKVQFFESVKKTTSIWEEVHKRGSIQWVIYKEFNSSSHFSKRRFRFFESLFFDTKFNSLNHISEKRRGSIL